ncbi:hypothetical protein PHET_02651 [Paragonimus heterotremus]|uniref:Uncharacterized protein n=1 Tax=Paragonimus heterotremus TaxID=100268 RepID=A0A8J4WKD9_9TREM|nr:hypothetical protein PHET_02651 [Paragonimus heterotremus]
MMDELVEIKDDSVGVDVGSQFVRIATIKDAKLKIIEYEHSKRRIPTYKDSLDKPVCFDNTVSNSVGEPSGVVDIHSFLQDQLHGKQNSRPIDYEPPWLLSSNEKVMKHLTIAKAVVRWLFKQNVKNVVINVPKFYTNRERRAIMKVCKLSKVNCLKLVNDTTAMYACNNSQSPAIARPTRNVLFVIMGATNTQVAIWEIEGHNMKAIASASDDNLGGYNFDQVIFDYLCEMQPRLTSAPMTAQVAVFEECEQIKMRLNSSYRITSINLTRYEGLSPCRYEITRSKFEALSAHLLVRFKSVLDQALQGSNMDAAQVSEVVLAGGGLRLTTLQRTIKDMFGRYWDLPINFSELVAQGCAIQMATFDWSHPVRRWEIIDHCPYAIEFKLESDQSPAIQCHPPTLPYKGTIRLLSKMPIRLTIWCLSEDHREYLGEIKVTMDDQLSENLYKCQTQYFVDESGVFSVGTASIKLQPLLELDGIKLDYQIIPIQVTYDDYLLEEPRSYDNIQVTSSLVSSLRMKFSEPSIADNKHDAAYFPNQEAQKPSLETDRIKDNPANELHSIQLTKNKMALVNRGHSLPGNKALRRYVTFSSTRDTNESAWNSAERKLTQLFTPPALNDTSKISITCEQKDEFHDVPVTDDPMKRFSFPIPSDFLTYQPKTVEVPQRPLVVVPVRKENHEMDISPTCPEEPFLYRKLPTPSDFLGLSPGTPTKFITTEGPTLSIQSSKYPKDAELPRNVTVVNMRKTFAFPFPVRSKASLN